MVVTTFKISSVHNHVYVSFLNFQYSVSKKLSPKPSRLFSWDRQSSGLLQGFQNDLDELKRVFDKFDSNRDGKISQQEYKVILRALGKENTIQDVPKICRACDLDGDGFIDFQEFVEANNKEGGVKRTDICSAFQTFDLNGGGKISAEEVLEVLKKLGERYSIEDCRRMVRAVDVDGDGMVNMEEFMTIMTSTLRLY